MLGNSRLSASAAWPDMPGLKIEQRGSEGSDVEGTPDWAEVRGWSQASGRHPAHQKQDQESHLQLPNGAVETSGIPSYNRKWLRRTEHDY